MTDLQSNVSVGAKSITGTLKYVDDYTGFSGDVAEQSGHYLVVHAESDDAEQITVQVVGGDHGAVALDEDGIAILRIKNTTQKVKFVATAEDKQTTEKTFTLTGLTLEPET